MRFASLYAIFLSEVLPYLCKLYLARTGQKGGKRNRIVLEVPLVANRSGYQRRGIWDSFDVVWGDPIIKLPRRQFLRLAAGAAALPTISNVAMETYPSRPVRIVVGNESWRCNTALI
jgi:hypothetical protein